MPAFGEQRNLVTLENLNLNEIPTATFRYRLCVGRAKPSAQVSAGSADCCGGIAEHLRANDTNTIVA